MIGGPDDVVTRLDPIFKTLAPGIGDIPRTTERKGGDLRPEQGYMYCGPAGSGHFVKMVHNGIEYGLMQAYAEGFDVLKTKDSTELPEDQRFTLNIPDIAEVWRRGSVVSSWLLDLNSPAMWQIPVKAAGPSKPRSRKRCRCPCSPPRSTRASVRGRITRSAKNFCPPCATNSAAISSSIEHAAWSAYWCPTSTGRLSPRIST
jgi:6-phosphogluconate dehydrogenase